MAVAPLRTPAVEQTLGIQPEMEGTLLERGGIASKAAYDVIADPLHDRAVVSQGCILLQPRRT